MSRRNVSVVRLVGKVGIWFWVALIALGALASSALAATRVEIVIDEPFADRSVPWPITTGVPFPRGALSDEGHCRLVDDTGTEQPLQSRASATWDAVGESIRWLTIDFIAYPARSYALEFGPDIRRRRFESPLVVEGERRLRVSTGAIRVEFTSDGPSCLGTIAADLDGDGRIEDDEVVASGASAGEHYYIDQNGSRFSSSADGAQRQVVVESSGPVRSCIRVDGFYTGPEGRRIVRYRTRFHLFAGLPLVKLVDEFGIVGSTKETQFGDIGLALDLRLKTAGRLVSADASGSPGNQAIEASWASDTESISCFQEVYRHYGNTEYHAAMVEVKPWGENRLKQSDRVGEWIQVADDRMVVTGALRWFWQQFPKEWEVTPGQLVLHLWSPRGGYLDFGPEGVKRFLGARGHDYLVDVREVRSPRNPLERHFHFGGMPWLERGEADGQGINKHHEILLHFGPRERAEEGAEYGRLAGKQPLALATPEWNCATDVLGPLMPRPNEYKYEAVVDRLFDLSRYAQDAFGDYGWWVFGAGPHYSYQWDDEAKRHYADPRRFEYHTYQKETQLWWCYLRSGERKFYDWAIPSENHWVDIATAHVPMRHRSDWRGGVSMTRTLRWRPGDWSVDGPVHYLRHHGTAEAWLRGGAQFWASYHRTLETTTLAYYLTGDERFNDVIGYWRDYWADLAGKTSASDDVKPWHREQAWFEPTQRGKAPKIWAEMIRDYAPFASGMRHQLTLFFNLATLYEHTWDPEIGQVLQEYADAFLDPDHRIGVWRSQENELPAHADAPLMAHYWTPALWKYMRATGDPRMPEILRRYFDACYAADPFSEDVGNYSPVHLGYAYYFTRDSRHLRPIVAQLERLMPLAAPLSQPEDLGRRIYNPYAPIRALTSIPRLTWALEEAKRAGIDFPTHVPLELQRTSIAFHKRKGTPVRAVLWGFDPELKWTGPGGTVSHEVQVTSRRYSSAIQPFDRNLPNFSVYVHDVTIPANASAGYYLLSPKLEIAVLELQGCDGLLCNAGRPIRLRPGETWWLRVPASAKQLRIETSNPHAILLLSADGTELVADRASDAATFTLSETDHRSTCRIVADASEPLWFQIADWPVEQSWIAVGQPPPSNMPKRDATQVALNAAVSVDPNASFVEGRFSSGLQLVPGRTLRIPDHVEVKGKKVPLFDLREGTIEFWAKQLWDGRLEGESQREDVTFLSNGLLRAWSPWKLPMGEWAHVAIVWRPFKRAPSMTVLHVYVNGVDYANYRSIWWAGYGGRRSFTLPGTGIGLGEFVSRPQEGRPFALDELRISSVARYSDPTTELGHRQPQNPVHFEPPSDPFTVDDSTFLLFHFDGELVDAAQWAGVPMSGVIRGID